MKFRSMQDHPVRNRVSCLLPACQGSTYQCEKKHPWVPLPARLPWVGLSQRI